MKFIDLSLGRTVFVLTADQRDSRTSADLVPAGVDLVQRAAGDRLAIPVQRNAGDELQALTGSAAGALAIALALLRDGGWSVGLGVGSVDTPLPDDIRAGRGPAFVLARDAVDRAKNAPGRVAVAAADFRAAQDAEAYLRLLVDLRDRRSAQGWEVADLLEEGLTQKDIAARLRITPTAVSLRAKAGGLRLEEAAIPALERTLAALDSGSATDPVQD
ncbi:MULTISPECIES: SatD family protein [unclassified Microbacterium]|uniref:SatD family protein n=1 Tax=unclassified Microbacterium TaxID=2609290 RepID=UPI00214B132D|nr:MULTISPECIES: SatD family protein [unclassified Microbacterium]MCR2809975.1 SatD family protein [Microbacterium sp. zg.B185]WIM20182.1 SatD family protein [Microbacterium sp. zg-B185]